MVLGWASLTPSTRRQVKRPSGRQPKFLGFENREDQAEEWEIARANLEKAKEAGLPHPRESAAVPESATKEAPVPVIVNETFVRVFSEGESAGSSFWRPRGRPRKRWAAPGWEIWGVVSDAKYQDLRSPIDPADRPRSPVPADINPTEAAPATKK